MELWEIVGRGLLESVFIGEIWFRVIRSARFNGFCVGFELTLKVS